MARPSTLPPAKPLLVVLLFFGLFVAPAHAQWGAYQTHRGAYTFHRGDRDGMFFPRKELFEPEFSLGPVVIRPGLGFSETYTSNLTLAPYTIYTRDQDGNIRSRPGNVQEEFITQLFPALGVKLPYKRNTFEVEYLGALSWYSRATEYDADNHYLTARAQLNVLKDSWIHIQSIYGMLFTPVEDVRTDAEDLNRRRRFNALNNYVGFHSPWHKKFIFSFQYNNAIHRFVRTEDVEGDYTRHQPGILLGYTVLPRTRLLLGYDFSYHTTRQQREEGSSDYQEHSLVYGVEYQMAQRFTMTLTGTYNWDEFKDAESLGVWGARVNARYTPLKRLSFWASYERTTRPTQSFTGERFDPDDPDTVTLYYIEDVANLACEYEFRWNLLLWANATYKRFDFPDTRQTGLSRIDNTYVGTLQVIYKFRTWLRLGVAGGYSWNDSNAPNERYEGIMGQVYVQGYL